MHYEIRSINGGQTGKVLAFVFFFVGLILAVILGLGLILDLLSESQRPSLGFIAALPFGYAIGGYVCVRIVVALYNRVAARRGGIALELGQLYDPKDPPWKP